LTAVVVVGGGANMRQLLRAALVGSSAVVGGRDLIECLKMIDYWSWELFRV